MGEEQDKSGGDLTILASCETCGLQQCPGWQDIPTGALVA